jgi:Rhodopirellula transposase DDE domain
VILSVLEEMVAPETAGDPMSAQRWIRSSLRTLSGSLEAAGHAVSPPTVGRLLRKLGYSLHVNAKKVEASSNHPDRAQQFDYIAVQRATFTAAGLPIVSVDTKKKELVGDFKNAGQTWSREPTAVNVHDYPHDALGRAVPYGVYDVTTNRGFMCLGTSGDTPAFAVDTISGWWQTEGRAAYPEAGHLLLLADAGGSNGFQIRAWKERLQVQFCDRFGLTVTVCHYPTGCSKWNPIEHRLFSQISRNWAGVPLRTWDTLLAFIRGTTTSSGLAVYAVFQAGDYPIGLKVTDAEMHALNLERHIVCPAWNYTIRPRTPAPASPELRELIL